MAQFTLRDCDLSRLIGVTQQRWLNLKRSIFHGFPLTDRQLKKAHLEATQSKVTDRLLLLDQSGLSLKVRAALLNSPYQADLLYNSTKLIGTHF